MMVWLTLINLLLIILSQGLVTLATEFQWKGVLTTLNEESNAAESTDKEYADAIRFGVDYSRKLRDLEAKLDRMGLGTTRGSSTSVHIAQLGVDPEVQEMARNSLVALQITGKILESRRLRGIDDKNMSFLDNYNQQRSGQRGMCSESTSCAGVDQRYRTADGSCNNLAYTSWGKAKSTYYRETPNCYDDLYGTPHTLGQQKTTLPNSRKVSYTVFPDEDQPSTSYSLMLMQFGQLIDHDVGLAGVAKLPSGQGISCCASIYTDFPELLHPECSAITIPRDDPYYAQYNEYCMNFVRSASTSRPNCYLGARDQINQLTSYIDGSMIYGNNVERQKSVRLHQGGLLNYTIRDGNCEYLPLKKDNSSSNPDDCALPAHSHQRCYYAGDIRASEVVHTTVLQTIYLREHNRIARRLLKLNPNWCDERLFQEARRIVVAEIQHVTYNEFLPRLLGQSTMTKYDLTLKSSGYFTGYNPSIIPNTGLAFATASYRLHSLIQGKIKYSTESKYKYVNLSSTYNNPDLINLPYGVDCLLRGLCSEPIQSADRYITTEVTNHLFKSPQKGYGLDLYAIDIHRGRDHGLCGYPCFRDFCGLSPIDTWEDMDKVMDPKDVEKLKTLYRGPGDVDLIVGCNLEYIIPGTVVGPTQACLNGKTFYRLKVGDRFWYENDANEIAFTPDQLTEIRKVTLSRLLCDNSDTIYSYPRSSFDLPSDKTAKVSCSDSTKIPRMKLKYWRQ